MLCYCKAVLSTPFANPASYDKTEIGGKPSHEQSRKIWNTDLGSEYEWRKGVNEQTEYVS